MQAKFLEFTEETWEENPDLSLLEPKGGNAFSNTANSQRKCFSSTFKRTATKTTQNVLK